MLHFLLYFDEGMPSITAAMLQLQTVAYLLSSPCGNLSLLRNLVINWRQLVAALRGEDIALALLFVGA